LRAVPRHPPRRRARREAGAFMKQCRLISHSVLLTGIGQTLALALTGGTPAGWQVQDGYFHLWAQTIREKSNAAEAEWVFSCPITDGTAVDFDVLRQERGVTGAVFGGGGLHGGLIGRQQGRAGVLIQTRQGDILLRYDGCSVLEAKLLMRPLFDAITPSPWPAPV